jgi:hypothetical protein
MPVFKPFICGQKHGFCIFVDMDREFLSKKIAEKPKKIHNIYSKKHDNIVHSTKN